MACCPSDSLPYLQTEYRAEGKIVRLADMDMYVVNGGGAGNRALIVGYDIYGFDAHSGRARAVCDQLADEGFVVVMPDFFRGQAWQPGRPFGAALGDWLRTMPYEPGLRADVHERVLPYLRREHGASSVAMVGFCWGAWLLFHASAVEGAIACGVSFHPSLRIEETVFGGSIRGLAAATTCPQLLMPAGNDPEEVQPGGMAMQGLMASTGERVRRCSLVHAFPEMTHGFGIKADLDFGDAKVCRDVGVAMKLAVDFLKTHML